MDKIFYLIPAYNAEDTIIDTLESIDFQSGYNPKVIIVNDGSTDNTNGVIRAYLKKRILLDRVKLIYQENSGVASALNRGLQEIPKGVWIFRLDADDLDILGRQKEMIRFMTYNNLDLAGSDMIEFGASNSVRYYPKSDLAIKIALNFNVSPFAHPSIVFSPRITHLLEYPKVYQEDLELYKTLKSKMLQFGNLPKATIMYRIHNLQITKSSAFMSHSQKIPKIKNILKIFFQIVLLRQITIYDKFWILRRALKLGILFR
jgi:glycosyltransferase involved in cell wall biosynthesis